MSKNTLRIFLWPILISISGFLAVWYQAGFSALFIVVILSILEVTLSFDNAVVNAKVLERMTPVWQKRFLTWGIAVAVFGSRFLLPILIVSLAVWASPWYITKLAFTDPKTYGELLKGVYGSITAFGGIFLMMVSLKYFFNKAKEKHWIRSIERHLAKWGRFEAIEIALALTFITTLSFFTTFEQADVLVAGIMGLILFVVIEGITGSLSVETDGVVKGGLALFMYLEILDVAFSLDGVIAAFALTTNLLIIVVGLGIGAFFVRALTLYFVQQKTLTELVFLEHGAHWAIFGLSIAMLTNLVVHVPEIVTGLVGLCFVMFAYYSSRKEMKQHRIA